MTRRRHLTALAVALAAGSLLAACGGGGNPAATPSNGASLQVVPQNSTLLVGVNRISVAILDRAQKPVLGATASLQVQGGGGTFETRPLQYIGDNYGQIPVYIGVAKFTQSGQYRFLVDATLRDGTRSSGSAVVSVTTKSPDLPVGFAVPVLRQRVAADVGGKLSEIDSGVPPDSFHTATIADGLAAHKPMILYFGEPGRCPSRTCGPTVQVLEQLYPQYKDSFLFEHIEIHDPAPSEAFNPVYVAFGLQSEPWVYFVNAQGKVADRFEGPVTVEQLRTAADGTLAGKVPAVDVSLG